MIEMLHRSKLFFLKNSKRPWTRRKGELRPMWKSTLRGDESLKDGRSWAGATGFVGQQQLPCFSSLFMSHRPRGKPAAPVTAEPLPSTCGRTTGPALKWGVSGTTCWAVGGHGAAPEHGPTGSWTRTQAPRQPAAMTQPSPATSASLW